ncbi:MAG: hypothetical protein GWO83_00485, partial [Bacteroidia bacterium]|nr:hypothetical protein [Bacteroidia bacterium]
MGKEGRIARLRAFGKSLTPRLAWDFLMVYLAIVNLGLILFDLTYLWLRPVYFQHLPAVTRLYDPVKGIEPEPLTTEYLALDDHLNEQLEAGAPPFELEPTLAELRALSVRIVEENPFERSGLTRSMIRALKEMQLYLQEEPGGEAVMEGVTSEEGLPYFWSLQPDPQRLPGRVEGSREQYVRAVHQLAAYYMIS